MSFFKKIYSILPKKKKREIPFLVLLLVIGMFFEMLSLGLLIPALTIILNPNITQEYPAIAPYFLYFGNPSHKEVIIGGMSLLIIIFLIKTLFLAFLYWFQNKFTSTLQVQLTTNLYAIYLNQDYQFHLNRNSAELIRNTQMEVVLFNRAANALILISTELAIIFAVVFTLTIVEPFGTFIVFIILSFSILIFHQLSKKKLVQWAEKRQDLSKEINQFLLEGLGGVKDIKLLGREDYFIDNYNLKNKLWARINILQLTLAQLPRLYLEFLGIFGLVILVIVMVLEGNPIDTLLPTLVVFAAGAFKMIPGFNRIMGAIQNVKLTVPVVNVLFNEFSFDKRLEKTSSNELVLRSEIFVQDVIFKYQNTQKSVINKINFKINKGESVGFVGKSGSGKSTLIDLILGLMNVNEGSILIDGTNINDNIRGWQNNIGYVPQNIYLTDDTLRKNIALGISEDQIDDKSIIRAMKQAQLNDFVQDLEEGIDTYVGERGVRLSGGQCQRIGIARAMYHSPSVLVLDEATSALDSATEKSVMEAVYQLKGEITIIIVAHRLSTLSSVDKIYHLERGKLIKKKKINNKQSK